MNLNLRYPNITGLSEKEQLSQIKSFLHQLVDQLNYANFSSGDSSQTYQVQGAELSYYELKSLILQEIQEVETLFAQLSAKMQSEYLPKSGWDASKDIVTDADGNVVTEDKSSGGAGGTFYTELSRISNLENGSKLSVICYGLTAGETYGLHLYTASRRKGKRQDPWRHPSNENTGEGYTGKGYANMAGRKYDEETLYPDVPEWMPRGGVLQTEWELTASAETEILDIDIGTWLLPMLKPEEADFDLDSLYLIGVSNGAIAPLLFQFRLVKNGTVGECRNTLRVGLPADYEVNEEDGTVSRFPRPISLGGAPAIPTNQLYTSIK